MMNYIDCCVLKNTNVVPSSTNSSRGRGGGGLKDFSTSTDIRPTFDCFLGDLLFRLAGGLSYFLILFLYFRE